jgi:hypothetical protein
MPDSQTLVQILEKLVAADLKLGANSVIGTFTTNDIAGGWEGWLQVAYAVGVLALGDTVDYNREITYPDSSMKCDLWFKAARGADIWIELKTQRYSSYTTTVKEWENDVEKIIGLKPEFLKSNVNLAIAVLLLKDADREQLNLFRTRGPLGTLKYLTLAAGAWTDVTATILTTQTGRILLATWRKE